LDDWLRAETEILGAQKPQKVKAAKGSKWLEDLGKIGIYAA
jgi:hypothetical protein